MKSKKNGPTPPQGERLQKVLASAGVASRRECELWIQDGRIEVDRRVVTELGTRVDTETQEIRVDGAPLKLRRRAYYLLNKPAGVVSTNSDPEGRTRVIDLIRSEDRLFPVGRLDRSSEGLMLVTNDGDLANKLAHPRFGIRKTYLALVQGKPTEDQLQQLRDGVYFAEGKAKVVSVDIKKKLRDQTILEIVLDEGRNREIRRMLARVGHKVMRLRRVAIGCIQLDDTASGSYRRLTSEEVAALTRMVSGEGSGRPRSSAPRKARGSMAQPKGGGKRRGAAKTKGAAAGPRSKQHRSQTAPTPSTGTVIGGELPEPTTSDRPRQGGKGAGQKRKPQGKTQGKAEGKRQGKRPAGKKRRAR